MRAFKALRALKKYYKADRKKLLLLAIAILVWNVESLLFAAVWGFILNYLILGKFFEAIIFLIINLVLFIFDISLDAYVAYLESKIEMSMLKNIQVDLFKKVMEFPAGVFEEHSVGELNNRIHGDTDQVVSLFAHFIGLIGRFVSAIIVVFVFLKINIILGLEIIVFCFITFLVSNYFSPRLKKANKIVKNQNDDLMKGTTQTLNGIREVKALGIKDYIFKTTEEKFTKVFNSSYNAQILKNAHNFAEFLIYSIFEFITLFTGAFLFYKEAIAITVIVLIYNYIGRVHWAVESYTSFIGDYQKLAVALERIDEILNDKLAEPEKFGDKVLTNIKGEIAFKNVDFIYPKDEKATLNNVTLTFKPKKKTAIVGASGSGKTSIFNLILHYFKQTSGEITIDDIDLREISEKSLRDTISVIRQDTFLFNLSIMDNFRMVKEDVTLKEVRQVCKAAYIDNYIMDLPNGYDSIIGENGVNLSGGQKQRLAIARALLRQTKIILFDEATSALDNKSQEYIKKTIDKLAKDHTIIIIAHRLSTIVDADEIIMMEKGKVVATGTHKKLMKNAKYKELYQPDIIN